MSDLKRTQFYDVRMAAMADSGGWEMPIEYPAKVTAEHPYTRHFCSLRFGESRCLLTDNTGRDLARGTSQVLRGAPAGMRWARTGIRV